jgi:hypothetical protein
MSALANSPVVSYREASQLIKNRACWQTPLHDKELWLSESLSESSVTKLDKAGKTVGLHRSKCWMILQEKEAWKHRELC